MANQKVTFNGGIGFWPILFIVFLVLKLTKVVTWSWWWIALPLYGPVLLIMVVLIGFLIYKVVQESRKKKRRARGLW